MRKLAPIVLFVYNRPEHTQRTVEALLQNELAAKSELIVFCDGAKNEQSRKSVNEVKEYVHSIKGFKNIKIHEQARNLGLANSIIAGVTEVVNNYGTIIVLEDDMVTSPYFLRYMNDALEMYENEDKVISIHGYCYPVEVKLPETFFLKGADCWGWATWQRGWTLFNPDGAELLNNFKTKEQIMEFNFNNSFPYFKMLRDQVKGKIDSWAIRWYASAFLNDRYTLYPGKSLVENTGFDSFATHCQGKDIYSTEILRQKIKLNKQNIIVDKLAYDLIIDFFIKSQPSLLNKTIGWIKNKLS